MSKGTYIELYNPESQAFEKINQPFISSKKLYDALDLQEKFKKGEVKSVKKELDLSLEFIEGLFDSEKVTKESILEGIAAADLMDAVNRIMSDVGKETEESSGKTQQQATSYSEAKQELNKVFKYFITELQWSYDDVANADFYHLMTILGEESQEKVMDGYSFIESL